MLPNSSKAKWVKVEKTDEGGDDWLTITYPGLQGWRKEDEL